MKNRTGFVSNSSSASFIVNWRMKTYGEEISMRKAIAILFDSYIYREETDEWVAEGDWEQKNKKLFEEVETVTKMNKDGSFTSSFWTSMKNSMDDFGDTAKSLTIAIVGSNNFEIVDAKVEDE